VVSLLAAAGLGEHVIPRVFLAIAIVIVVARIMGAVARKLRQPAVVGEIIGGIALGPTLLGAFPGGLDQRLFPTDIRPFLTVIANLGLVIFMFIVGLELDTSLIRGKERIAGLISLTSVAAPMAMGFTLALALHGRYGGPGQGAGIDVVPFGLFIGAAMSVTAFPVLARILVDRGMYRTALGSLTLACAAVDDILAWALLAVVLAVVKTGTFLAWDFPRILGLTVAFGAVMWLVVRPQLARLVPAFQRQGRLTPNLASVVLIGFLVSSFVTAEIGIHHILGAFVFGAVMPREGAHALTLEILERLEQISVLLLLPVFFVTTGLNVNIGALDARAVGVLLIVLLVAIAGKFLGATAAARLQGIGWRRSAAIGTLMNTRGLTELIVLTVGRENGVLNDTLFTIMVVMAVVTTVITEPGLRLFYPDALLARDIAEAERSALGAREAYRVMLVVDDPARAVLPARVAAALAQAVEPSEVVLTRLVPPGPAPELGAGLSAQLLEMTGAMEAMANLERQVTATGVECSVVTRFSDNSNPGLASLLASMTPDLALITDPAADVRRLAGLAETVVGRIVVPGARSQPVGASSQTPDHLASVSVVIDDGAPAGRLVDFGLHLAAHATDPTLRIVARGRAARRLGRFAELQRPDGTPLAALVDEADLVVNEADVVIRADSNAGTPSGPGTYLQFVVPTAVLLDLDDVHDRWAHRTTATTDPDPDRDQLTGAAGMVGTDPPGPFDGLGKLQGDHT
jgi:Kef-type K+ transport system membrane component KefB